MTALGCSTNPSITLIKPPEIDLGAIKPIPPVDVMKGCDPLLKYTTDDKREVITTTIKNHNIYSLCASKLRSAIIFIDSG